MNSVNATAWAAVATAGLGFSLAFGAFIRRSIKNSIDNLANVLDERLATKEMVNDIERRISILEVLNKVRDSTDG